MGFTTAAFIRRNTPELRKKLEELGYKKYGNPFQITDDSKLITTIDGEYVPYNVPLDDSFIDCGTHCVVRSNALTTGNTKSCGCLINESKNIKHGLKNTRIYRIWYGMKSRCYTKSNPAYNRYGGRGISMCQQWKKDFTAFYNWSMDNGYSKELSIDRINHNGNYEPSNCRWATPKEQSDNKRCNILITINGTTLDLQQWCDKIGIKRSTVNTRVRMCGWTYEKALSTPVRKHKEYKVR